MMAISLAHLIIVSCCLAVAVRVVRTGRRSLLSFTVAGFAVFSSMGLAIAPYVPLENIGYLLNPVFLIRSGDVYLYTRQLLAHWLFLLVAVVGMSIEMAGQRPSVHPHPLSQQRLVLWGLIVLSVGLGASVRYFVFGPGLELLMDTRLFWSSTVEAIAHRSVVRDTVESGQGAYMASLASKIVFPVAALIILRSGTRGRHSVVAICAVFSSAFAIQTRQKGPLLAVILVYALLMAADKSGKRFGAQGIGHAIARAGLIALVGGATFYVLNFGQPFWGAIASVCARLLFIPGATETNYFAVFPEFFQFRGLDHVFNMALRWQPGMGTDEVAIYDVAFAATGDTFSSNASFLAVAWSGWGLPGVGIASLLLVSSLLFIDLRLKEVDQRTYLGVLALSTQSILGLISGSLMDFVSWGGVIIPLAVLFVIRTSRKGRRLSRESVRHNQP